MKAIDETCAFKLDTYRYLKPDKIKYSWWTYMRMPEKNNAGEIDYI